MVDIRSLLVCVGLSQDDKENENINYTLIGDVEDNQLGMFDKPLPCCGCGLGWFS